MVTIHYEAARGTHRLEVNGHAGAGPKGKDIVCAGVSVLVHMAAQRLLDMKDSFQYEPQIILSPGQALLVAADRSPGGGAEGLFQTVLTGFRQLQEQYPGFVTLLENKPP